MPSQRVNVLMIDDESDQVLLMGYQLEEAWGSELRFAIEGAESLAEGLRRLDRSGYDVILLDLGLPDSKGLETLAAVRRRAGDTPIVVLTWLADEAIGLKAIGQGAQDYLFKDQVEPRALRRAIRYSIERSVLARQLRELEALRAELKERRKSDMFKDRLLGAVSHDLRTPLTIAQTAVMSLADGRGGKLSPQQTEFADIARRSLDRLGRLVLNVLDFSRLDSGRACVQPRRVDVSRLVCELTGDWRRSLTRSLAIEVSGPQSLPDGRADADLLAQVLYNLLDNAARYAQTRVSVSLSSSETMLRLTVQDDGPGVPAERADDIFEPFVQASRPEGPGYNGTGLGLTICRRIAEVSGGKIWAENGLEGGARFHFEVPRWEGAAVKSA